MNVRVFLANARRGIVRAVADAGGWRTQNLLSTYDVRCMAAYVGGGVLLAGSQGDGVLCSDDDGASWSPAGLAGRIVKAVAVSPHDPDVFFAGLKPAAMAVSRDGGATWCELDGFRRIRGRRLWFSPAEPPGTAYVQGIALSPADPDIILAGIEFGAVVRSADGGRTWSGHRRGALRDCHSLRFHAVDGTRVYQGGTGLRRPFATSRDAGLTWERHREGFDRSYGWACAADPADPDICYVSAAPGPGKAHGPGPAEAYIFRRRGGTAWQKLDGGLPRPLDHMPYALITDPSAPGHLYAGLDDGHVWFTADRGDTWSRLPLEMGPLGRAMMAVFDR